MDVLKKLFNYLSYLQYPIMLSSIYFVTKPYLNDFLTLYSDLNNTLIILGLGISFSTLQDTTKTQNDLSKKIWSDPKRSKRWLVFMLTFCLSFMLVGAIGFFAGKESVLKELSVGLLVFSIGFLGMIKAALDMAEYHQNIKK